jgi:hypothetical protein
VRSDDVLAVLGQIFMFLLYLSPIIFIVWRTRRSRAAIRKGDGLDEIALALGGEVTKDAAFDEPVVRFSVAGIPCYCRRWNLFEGKPDVVTTFECRAGFEGFFEATAGNALRYPSRSSRFCVLGEESGFQVVTTSPAWATDLLVRGLGKILEDFSRWRRPRLTLAYDRFLVETESWLAPEEMTQAARLIARVAALRRPSDQSVGVTFLDGVQVSAAGRCPVCGQTFDLPKVHCAQCKVPHHTDCWAYWGRCAIFGCRSVRSA